MRKAIISVTLGGLLMVAPVELRADTVQAAFEAAMAREHDLRSEGRKYTLRELRLAIAAYESIVRRFPRSGYSDNALWQASGIALEAYLGYGESRDRQNGLLLIERLVREYPSSSLVKGTGDRVRQFQTVVRAASAPARPKPPVPAAAPAPVTRTTTAAPDAKPTEPAAPAAAAPTPSANTARAYIREVSRTTMTDVVRVTIHIDTEVPHRVEEIANPRRLFFDFQGAQTIPALTDASFTYQEDAVREIRLGRRPQNTTRLVLDLEGVTRYSVFTLYNPYRVVIDCERRLTPALTVTSVSEPTPVVAFEEGIPPLPVAPAEPDVWEPEREDWASRSANSESSASPPIIASQSKQPLSIPTAPSANASGNFSIARQLGLGISRVVIDPGHGGHDPGARSTRGTEAALVLDVALRLEKLLLDQRAGIEVVVTRRSDIFVPLEERTAIANRESADLFLSIHANASRNTKAGGVETYFLNFASSPEAGEVAARENAASGRDMRNLPDIVQAIALNNKLDESREFAELVQSAIVGRLRTQNRTLKDLGVKRAPFVVLIGASMPSVLAEISFLTNKLEGQLLGTTKYRQGIAEALLEAVMKYRRSLKSATTASVR